MLQVNDRVRILADEYPYEYGRHATVKEVLPSEAYGTEYRVQRDGDLHHTYVSYVEGELERIEHEV